MAIQKKELSKYKDSIRSVTIHERVKDIVGLMEDVHVILITMGKEPSS